jgi:hypothetical protein
MYPHRDFWFENDFYHLALLLASTLKKFECRKLGRLAGVGGAGAVTVKPNAEDKLANGRKRTPALPTYILWMYKTKQNKTRQDQKKI